MQLKEAFRKLYLDNNKEQLFDPFYVYSFLSDYVYDDYKSKEFIKLYYKVTTKINIFEYLINNNLEDGLKLLKSKQKKYDKFFTFLDFKRCVFISVLAINPNFIVNKKEPEKVVIKVAPVKKATPVKSSKKVKSKPTNNKPIKTTKKAKKRRNFFVSLGHKIGYIFRNIKKNKLYHSSRNLYFNYFDRYIIQSYFLQILFIILGVVSLVNKNNNLMNITLFISYGFLHILETTLEIYVFNTKYVRYLRRALRMNLLSFVSFIIFVILFSLSSYIFIIVIPLVLSTLFLIFYVRYTEYM